MGHCDPSRSGRSTDIFTIHHNTVINISKSIANWQTVTKLKQRDEPSRSVTDRHQFDDRHGSGVLDNPLVSRALYLAGEVLELCGWVRCVMVCSKFSLTGLEWECWGGEAGGESRQWSKKKNTCSVVSLRINLYYLPGLLNAQWIQQIKIKA